MSSVHTGGFVDLVGDKRLTERLLGNYESAEESLVKLRPRSQRHRVYCVINDCVTVKHSA